MPSTVYRLRAYTVTPDLTPTAEPHSYALQCTACSETGPRSDDAVAAHDWVPTHLRAHPGHLMYRELLSRPYRAVPGAWL